MANDLLTLPQELRIQILSHLDAISLTRCAMACKSMYETLQITSQLAYIVLLNFEGLEDAGTSTAHSELITRLLRHRQAWLSPNAIEKREYVALNMKHECQAYELVGGAFADTNIQHFEIIWLPTASNLEGRRLQRASTGMRIRDFAMDPTQDVIAFLEDDSTPSFPTAARNVRIHIRTISTNVVHPLAQQSPLQISIPRHDTISNTIHNAFLQFARNTLVLYFCTSVQIQPYIQIWDWTTSDVIVDSSLPFDRSILAQTYEFGLLDSTYCFVTSTTSSSGSIRLYKLTRSPSATRAPIHVATLYLPPTANGVEVERISAHTGPIEANPLSHIPFTLKDDDRLHVFTIQYTQQPMGSYSRVFLNMFVHQRVFTKYCTQRTGDGDEPLRITWAEWGPMNTKLICPAMIQRHWLRYVHGQRVVLPYAVTTAHETLPERSPNTVEVFDFSLAAVLSAKGVSPMPALFEKAKPGRLVTSSTIRAGQIPIFKDDVETHLPYVSTHWNLKQSYLGYMIHQDGIIGVHSGQDEPGHPRNAYAFPATSSISLLEFSSPRLTLHFADKGRHQSSPTCIPRLTTPSSSARSKLCSQTRRHRQSTWLEENYLRPSAQYWR